MTQQPLIAVAAICERDGRFLVVEETVDGRTVINQPAGHLEHGETLLHAIQREVMEETAWEFEPQAVVGVYLYPQPDRHTTWLRICFTGRAIAERDSPLDEGIIRALWLSRAELAAQAPRLRSPLVLRCIDDYLAGRRYGLDLITHVA